VDDSCKQTQIWRKLVTKPILKWPTI
jgi:hypothetical protein